MTENKIMYHCFPRCNQILSVWLDSTAKQVLPEWHNDESGFFCVTAVSDDAVKDYFFEVRKQRDEFVGMIEKCTQGNTAWDIGIKPLFRFKSVEIADRFINLFWIIVNKVDK